LRRIVLPVFRVLPGAFLKSFGNKKKAPALKKMFRG
jgi:hypothetical protein